MLSSGRSGKDPLPKLFAVQGAEVAWWSGGVETCPGVRLRRPGWS